MECLICKRDLKNYKSIVSHVRYNHYLNAKAYYDKYIKKYNEGICLCGKETNFENINKGYKNFCSSKCMRMDKNTTEKRNKTFQERFGGHPSKNIKVQEKRNKTFQERFGGHPSKNIKVQEKRNKTFQERFGGHPLKNEKVLLKMKETFKRNGGYPSQRESVIQKRKITWLSNLGVDHPSKSIEIKEKKKKTSLKNFGVEHPMQSEIVKNNFKNSYIKLTGFENPSQNHNIKEKKKNTCLKNFGVEHPMQSEIIKDKVHKIHINLFNNKIKTLAKNINIKILEEYKGAKEDIKIKCLICNNEYISSYFAIQQGYGKCPICYPKYKSIAEQEIINYIKSFNLNIIENTRKIIKPLELDIYIPEKKIAIEYNGLYWHSEQVNNDKNYHLNKLKMCQEKGILLIQIFEDEWVFKQEIVKARIKQILKVSNSTRIHARQCVIREIDPKIKNKFLEKYHLQGKDNSKIKLGAFYNDELVSIMTFSKGNIAKGSKSKIGVWELNRFCSNYEYHIPGIASKLLTFFKSNYEYKQIFSYADRRWSIGNVYYKLGFSLDSITKPNYWYVKGLKRIHRFNLRKRPNEPKDIPESVLRAKEGYSRVWDCGHLKFNNLH